MMDHGRGRAQKVKLQRSRVAVHRRADERGCGEASVCEKEKAGKQSQLTIFCDATGAGSSLYFRALSGACDSDMVIVRGRWRSKDAGKTGLSAGRRGLGVSAVALACNFTRSNRTVVGEARAASGAVAERRTGREINVNVLKPLMHARLWCCFERASPRMRVCRDQGSPVNNTTTLCSAATCELRSLMQCRQRLAQPRAVSMGSREAC